MSEPVSNDPSAPDLQHSPRRDSILAEAAQLFNERGFHDTRLSDVADRLGLVKTTISYHFRSKEALLQQLYGQACEAAESDLAAAQTAPTGLEGIRLWLRRNFERESDALSGRASPLAIVADLDAMTESERPALRRRLRDQARVLRSLVERGQADGSVRVTSIDATVHLLLGLRQWLRDWILASPPVDPDTRLRGLEALLLHGLCADRSWRPGPTPVTRQDDALSGVFDREARSRLKREAFLRAGTRFLNRQGFRNLSLQDVAADLGVSRSAFYYYIADKDALLQQSVDRTLQVLEDAINLSLSGQRDAVSRLWDGLRYIFLGHVNDLDPMIRPHLLNALPPARRAVALARYRKLTAGFGQIIADGLVDGSVRPVNVEGAEHIMIGALFAAGWPRLDGEPCTSDPSSGPDRAPTLLMAYFQPLFTGLARRGGPGALDR
jgi:AcrR family transcriptional regulator